MKKVYFIIVAIVIILGVYLALAPSTSSAHSVEGDSAHTGDHGKPTFVSNLALGSRGAEVTALQTTLKGLNNIYPEGLITGYFGLATQRAILRLQKVNGLEQVGKVGPKTRAVLNQALAGNPQDYSYLVPQINDVFATTTSASHLYVFWTTNKFTTSEFFYATQTPLASTTPVVLTNPNKSLAHSQNVYNLATGTTYYYMIKVTDQFGVSATSSERSITTLSQ